MSVQICFGLPADGMSFEPISWDVSWQGVYCLTLTAPSYDEAQTMAMHALGLDSLWAIEVSQNTESQPGAAQIKPL